MTRLVLINGASGVGKTSIANYMVQIRPSLGQIHPDGLWDTPHMESAAILKLAAEAAVALPAEVVVIDCQIRPSETEAIVSQHADAWTMFLLDCPDELREQRLLARGWSADSLPKLRHWQKLLRTEAEELGIAVLDTSQHSLVQTGEAFLRELDEST